MISLPDSSLDRLPPSCPICNSQDASKHWAVIAPFIRTYVRPAHSSLVSLCECSTCQHRYFDYRYSDAELGRLYGGYRGEAYYQARHRVEPWYGINANEANLDPVTIDKRLAGLRAFMLPLLGSGDSDLVIADLGGDAGQFIPLDLAQEAYVIEASQRQPVPGVTLLRDISELSVDVDLLLCSHVLEHIPRPMPFLRSQLASARIKSGCLVYLEVPLERYSLSTALGSKIYSAYLKYVLRMPFVLIFIDFLSVVSRSYLGLIVPPLILKMHEHVNFFSPESVLAMINALGLELLDIDVELESSLATHQGVIRALARTC
jgi:hypothetical protein